MYIYLIYIYSNHLKEKSFAVWDKLTEVDLSAIQYEYDYFELLTPIDIFTAFCVSKYNYQNTHQIKCSNSKYKKQYE